MNILDRPKEYSSTGISNSLNSTSTPALQNNGNSERSELPKQLIGAEITLSDSPWHQTAVPFPSSTIALSGSILLSKNQDGTPQIKPSPGDAKRANLGSELHTLRKGGTMAKVLISFPEATLVSNTPTAMDSLGQEGVGVRDSDLFLTHSVDSQGYFKHCFCPSGCGQSPRESAQCQTSESMGCGPPGHERGLAVTDLSVRDPGFDLSLYN